MTWGPIHTVMVLGPWTLLRYGSTMEDGGLQKNRALFRGPYNEESWYVGVYCGPPVYGNSRRASRVFGIPIASPKLLWKLEMALRRGQWSYKGPLSNSEECMFQGVFLN